MRTLAALTLCFAVACSASATPAIGDAAPQCSPGERYSCDCGASRPKGSALCSASATRGGCDCQGAVGETDASTETPPDASCAQQTAFYQDSDGDGFGTGVPTMACEAPAGYVTDNTDCDDTDARVHPGQTAWFRTPRTGAPPNLAFDYNCDNGTQKCCVEAESCESQGCH